MLQVANYDLVQLSFGTCVASCVGCYALFKLLSLIAPVVTPVYKTLKEKDQRDWDSRAVSVIHAVLVWAIAVYVIYWNDLFTKEGSPSKWQRYSPLNHVSLGISMGYFTFDIVMLAAYYPHFGEWEFLGHHIVALAGVLATVLTGQAQYITMFMGTVEATSLFVHMRWYLEKAGLKTQRVYVVNGLLLMIVWFITRVWNYTSFFLYLAIDWQSMVHDLSPFMFCYAIFSSTWILVLNYFWFSKILRGAFKVLVMKKHD